MVKVDYINISQYDEKIERNYHLMFCIYNFITDCDSCMDVSGRLDIVRDVKSYSKIYKSFSYTVRK